MERITSPSNLRFKAACRLHRSRGRRQQNRIIVFGTREVMRARQAGIEFLELALDDRFADSPDAMEWTTRIATEKTDVYSLASPLFSKLSFGDRNDWGIGIAERPETTLDTISVSPQALIVVVEGVENPGNLGAIARSADGCGVDALLVADPKTDPFHPNAIRASMATVFSVPIACAPTDVIQAWIAQHQISVFLATPEASQSVYATHLAPPLAMVLGSEAEGLSPRWRTGDWNRVKLPMRGTADSLNVSVTASLMMYEARRQIDQAD